MASSPTFGVVHGASLHVSCWGIVCTAAKCSQFGIVYDTVVWVWHTHRLGVPIPVHCSHMVCLRTYNEQWDIV